MWNSIHFKALLRGAQIPPYIPDTSEWYKSCTGNSGAEKMNKIMNIKIPTETITL